MSPTNTTTPHSVKPSTLRVRRYRERRREGLCASLSKCPRPILRKPSPAAAKPDHDAWDVLDAYYADVLDAYYAGHLSDAALEWLIKNKVIKNEQRGDVAAILSGISDWLERAQNE